VFECECVCFDNGDDGYFDEGYLKLYEEGWLGVYRFWESLALFILGFAVLIYVSV
jgi:hypothetical protein